MSGRSLHRRVTRRVRRLVGRPAATPVTPSGYYADVSPTCQIPHLSFLYERYLGSRSDGRFVEVGAYDGYSFSNTSCLATAGWHGVYVEPVEEFATRCRDRYADNPRIEVVHAAIGATEGPLVVNVAGSLSTANPELLTEYERTWWARASTAERSTVTVPQLTLDRLLESRSTPPGFDLLVVDVEGFEQQVFAGFDLDAWRPTMMIVELADAHPDLVTTRSDDARLLLSIVDRGYVVAYKDSINTVFVERSTYERTSGA